MPPAKAKAVSKKTPTTPSPAKAAAPAPSKKKAKLPNCIRQTKALVDLMGPFNICLFIPSFVIFQPFKKEKEELNPLLGFEVTYPPEFPLTEASITSYALLIGGPLLIVLGFLLMVPAIRAFHFASGTIKNDDPPATLVTSGPYAFVRNPIAISYALILTGLYIISGLTELLVINVFLSIGTAIWICCKEEPELRERFGQEYGEYEANVLAWLPRCCPYDPAQSMV